MIPQKEKRLIGKAMHTYRMLNADDRVLLAVSGGIDSMVLARVMHIWQEKTPFSFTLIPVHIDPGFTRTDHAKIKGEIDNIGLSLQIEKTKIGEDLLASGTKNICFSCARRRRNKLFELARHHNCNKLAFGHHKDDIIETFFINLFYGGNLSTMVPCQPLFEGSLKLIRPLAFLDKSQIRKLATIFQLKETTGPCPMEEKSRRNHIRNMLAAIYQQEPDVKNNIFASLANVRSDYLLTKPDSTDENSP